MRYLILGFIYGPGIWLVMACGFFLAREFGAMLGCIIMVQLRKTDQKE